MTQAEEQELRNKAGLDELQTIINILLQRCINLRGDLVVLAAKTTSDKTDPSPLRVVE